MEGIKEIWRNESLGQLFVTSSNAELSDNISATLFTPAQQPGTTAVKWGGEPAHKAVGMAKDLTKNSDFFALKIWSIKN